MVLDASGNVVGSQLYGPYGNQRSSTGTLPTSIGFTGQRADSLSGLDYSVARYYDPVVGQFVTADVVQGNAQGMDPYAYVAGNPETLTDPTGQRISCPLDCGTSGGGGGAPCTLGDAGCGSPPLTSCDSGFHLSGGSCIQDSSGACGCKAATTHSSSGKSGQKHSDSCANDGKCLSDRDHIKDHIRAEQNRENNLWTAIGDAVSLGADIIAALLELGLGQYLAFGLEVASIVTRVAVLAGDLASLGLFSLPTAVVDILQAFKVVASIIDAAGALVSWLNPGKVVGDSVKFLGMTLGKSLVKFIIAGSVGASITGTLGIPKVRDAFYWKGQIDAVDNYNAQQAYSVCEQDYSTSPAGYC